VNSRTRSWRSHFPSWRSHEATIVSSGCGSRGSDSPIRGRNRGRGGGTGEVQPDRTGTAVQRVVARVRTATAARNLNPPAIQDNLIHSLGGDRQIRGIPFRLGPADVERKSWIVLSTRTQPWSARTVEIPIGRTARFLCLAQFCDWDPAEFDPEDVDAIERIGETLAEPL